MIKYFVYWHPKNKVDEGVRNPLSIEIHGGLAVEKVEAEVKEVLSDVHPGMKDFVILTAKLEDSDEALLFENFEKAGQSK